MSGRSRCSILSKLVNILVEHGRHQKQVSEIFEDNHIGLAARLGFIGKKISLKNQVKVHGCDPPKLRKCKACYAPITIQDISTKDKKLILTCQLCGLTRDQKI